MALDLVARLIRKMPVQSGSTARGEWSKQEFVVETLDMYPRKVCMSVWGADKISELKNFAEGETLRFSLNIESREYNNRWYTDVRAWKIDRNTETAPVAAPAYPASPASPAEMPSSTPMVSGADLGEQEDDLPF
ncbi:MAG: DUF3127 domain-containing protein [Bacteroidales bacterium]|nr:DUF3127 domain-containing protein [Bacteroidales bacterium]